jgi:hypothetical protein
MKFLSDVLAKAGLVVDGVVTFNNTATGQTPDANDNSTKLATTAWVRGFVTPYSLPIASGVTLGGVKVGSGLAIDGTGVLSVSASGVGAIRALQQITATTGQTVFTVSGGYTPGLIDVFLNGVLLTPTAITATNGTTFTLADPAVVNDLLDIFVYNPIYNGFITSTDQVPEGSVNLYFTNTRARAAISLTVTGSSGASTYSSITGVLNVPTYTLDGLGGVPTSRTLTINGVTYDLTANRSWSALPVGGVAGQLLAKVDGTDYNAQWINEAPAASYTSQVKHVVKSSQAITKGQAVYVSSADGTNMIVSKASNATEATSSKTMGLLESTVAINGTANVVTEGLLAGLDTTGANAAGDPVWLGTDGNLIYGLTNKPSAPAHLVFIGVVTRRNANNGEIFVKVQNGYELDELHDLSVKNPSDGDMIKYVASTGLWTKVAASTTNIVEGTNLYYTQGRFDTAFAAKSTTNLAEGTNLYYTDARVGTYLTNNSYATQTYVNTAVSNLVDAAPGTLDTLNELAAALGDDPNFATTVATSIGTKVPQTRTLTINGTTYDLSADRSWTIASGVTSFNTRTGAITSASGDYTTAQVTESGNLYYTDARARLAISLTTTGTSGAATYDNVTGVLNIPQYQGGVTSFNTRTGAITLSSTDVTTALGYTPVTNARTLTINGEAYDLTADRTWTVGVNPSARTIQTYTATASQTTFTVTGGYVVGLVDVFINGVRLTSADFTATDGTTVVLSTGTGVNNIVDIVKYTSAFTASNALRQVTYFTATAGQTTFTVSYTPGLIDVFYNGSKLASSEYTATNGTTVVLTNAAVLNDALEIIAYAYSVGAFTGQAQLNGTGFVKVNGTTVTYDNSTYLTTSSASSTYATISSLSQYLPLIGGTLTGTLNGTISIFSNTITAGDNYLINNLTASKKGYRYQSPASNWGPQVSGLYFTPNNAVDAQTTFTVELWNGLGSIITPLSIASTGAATFSSSVTTNANEGFIIAPSSGASYMNYRIGGTSYSLIGVAGATSDIIAGSALGDLNIRATNSQKILFSTNNGGSAAMAIASSGNVGIGTTSPERDAGTRSLAISGAGSLAASLDLYGNARNFAIFTGGAGSLGFFDLTAGAQRLTITSVGDLSFKGRSTTANYDAVFYNDNSQFAINANNTNVGKTINFNVRNDQNAMTITSNGYVWVNGAISGFTASAVQMQVNGQTRFGGDILLHSGSNSAQAVRLSCDGSDSFYIQGGTALIGTITNFGPGTGVYTRATWYNDTVNQCLFENARQTDSSTGTGRTVYFTWRGGPSVGGGVQLQHGTNAWAAYTSDARLKTKVADIENGIDTVMKLNPIKFKWSRELENSRTVTGFTAQNVEEAIPDAVFNSWKDDELGDVKSYYQDYLVPYLVKAIQELKLELDALKSNN